MIQRYDNNNNALTMFSQQGRALRNIAREEDKALANVEAAYTVASAGAARVASLTLSGVNFAQMVPEAGPRLGAIADGLTVVVITQVAKFAR